MRIRTLLAAIVVLALGQRGAAAPAEDSKAAEVLAAARKAIGGKKLDALKTLSVEASLQRNVGTMQMTPTSRSCSSCRTSTSAPTHRSGGMMTTSMATGFNGEKPIRPRQRRADGPAARMVIRMGPGGPMHASARSRRPRSRSSMTNRWSAASRAEVSRLMLGWFAMAHPALAREYTYAGEAESPDGKAHVDRREERRRLQRAALHRPGDAPAADGHLPGPAAARDHAAERPAPAAPRRRRHGGGQQAARRAR